MDFFEYHDGQLMCEQVSAAELAAAYGTPLYAYSRATFESQFDALRTAFAPMDPLICFSIKSCQNLQICRLLAERGSGFDVVSGGELYRALRAGVDPSKIVFAGVGKTVAEIREALSAGVGLVNIESHSELGLLAEQAELAGRSVRAALRVNPDVDPHTHAYTTTGKRETKFGVDIEDAPEIFAAAARLAHLDLCGLHVHIGSPVHRIDAFRDGVARTVQMALRLRDSGFELDALDIGGGFGASYAGDEAPALAEYAKAVAPLLQGLGMRVILEPGRCIAANAGILLSRVLHVKTAGDRRFVVTDASMNELIRPALYGAYHFVWPVDAGDFAPGDRAEQQPHAGLFVSDVVGPVCESADFLARGRRLPPFQPGDLLATFSAGAYAMTMSSQYNSRPRPPEVLVAGDVHRLIRRRETYEDLVAAECTDGCQSGRTDEP
jgi:diaminopimelate decarboxylase